MPVLMSKIGGQSGGFDWIFRQRQKIGTKCFYLRLRSLLLSVAFIFCNNF
jgi:hypothetical protein